LVTYGQTNPTTFEYSFSGEVRTNKCWTHSLFRTTSDNIHNLTCYVLSFLLPLIHNITLLLKYVHLFLF